MVTKDKIFALVFFVLFYKVLDTGQRMVSIPFNQKSGLWQNWTAEKAGEQLVLPSVTWEIHQIINQKNAKDFFLSAELLNDQLIYQRTIESLFPLPLKRESHNHFFLNSEGLPANCQKIIQKQMVSLAQCD